jgi:predicted nucleic acid-binding protein
MARFVLDNSIVMAWCFEDESSAMADAVLEQLQTKLAIVPAIWPLEVGNALLVAERRGRLSEADSAHFLTMLSALPIQSEIETRQRAMSDILFLAREHKLSSYDASYLDLAMREGVPLATLDKGLKRAANQCHVSLVLK